MLQNFTPHGEPDGRRSFRAFQAMNAALATVYPLDADASSVGGAPVEEVMMAAGGLIDNILRRLPAARRAEMIRKLVAALKS